MDKNIEDRFLSYFMLAIGAFTGFIAEPFVTFIEILIYGIPFWGFDFQQTAVHYVILIGILIIWTYFISTTAKEKHGIYFFKSTGFPGKNDLNAACCLLLITMIISSGLWQWRIKPVEEFFIFYNSFDANEAIALFVLLYIKYAIEAILIFQIIQLGQKALAIKIKKVQPTLGGLFLAFTWGLLQAVLKGFFPWFLIMVNCLLFGITFYILRNNKKIGFIFILLMFWF